MRPSLTKRSATVARHRCRGRVPRTIDDVRDCGDSCSDVRVTAESECKEVPFDSSQYGCTTEHDRTFSSGRLIVAIIATVLGLVLLSASLPEL